MITSTVELALSPDVVVRGRRWQHGPDTVLLLHEPGRDLDAWDDLPELLHGDGLSVVALDLPGHGLSDGPWRPEEIPAIVRTVARSVAPGGEHGLFIVAAGLSATAALLAPAARPISGIVAFSPVDTGSDSADPGRPPARPKLVFAGALNREALIAARAIAKQAPGWCAVSTFPTTVQGTGLLASDWGGQAREQTRRFLRDCRRQRSAR